MPSSKLVYTQNRYIRVVYQTQIFTYKHLIFYIHGILYTILNKCGIYSIDTKVAFYCDETKKNEKL